MERLNDCSQSELDTEESHTLNFTKARVQLIFNCKELGFWGNLYFFTLNVDLPHWATVDWSKKTFSRKLVK